MSKEAVIIQQILVAEDDPSILRLVKKVLEEDGYGVIAARDGREAIKFLFSGDLFAAAIFDINLPHIDGIELLKMMQTDLRSKQIPVIIMTAEENSLLMSESYQSGAVAFLPKPFSIHQIQSILRTFVAKN